MTYSAIYCSLIERRRSNPLTDGEYGEVHHIIPKSEGGDNSQDNLIRLSAREHYVAHLLLAKIYDDQKMYSAVMYMRTGFHSRRKFKYNSRLYEKMRIKFGKKISILNRGKTPWNKGKTMGSEFRIKSSQAHKGIKLSRSSYDRMARSMSKLIWITNGIESKRINIDEQIPDNWHKGRGTKCRQSISTGCKGRPPWNKGKRIKQ